MEIGKTVRGTTVLAFDVVEGVAGIVEGMTRNIAAFPLPVGEAPDGPAPGIAGIVYESIRRVNRDVRGAVDRSLGHAAPWLDRFDARFPAGPNRHAAIAALNGVCGDHLADTGNPLALPMRLRHRGAELALSSEALAAACPDSKGRLLIALHGLAMSPGHFDFRGHNHVEMLARDGGYTPLYLDYNTGLHVSTNGRNLARLLQRLLDAWPGSIASLTLLGFSMGGLVLRSALHHAAEERLAWPRHVDKAVYVGTPHHGSAIERGGNWLQAGVGVSPYTAPLAALGRVRSCGITDLRHGNLLDEDWQDIAQFDGFADLARRQAGDRRRPVPLAPGIRHYAIAATLSAQPRAVIGRLLGDGLVHPSSATGRHRETARTLAFDPDEQRILYGCGHLSLLGHPGARQTLREWLL